MTRGHEAEYPGGREADFIGGMRVRLSAPKVETPPAVSRVRANEYLETMSMDDPSIEYLPVVDETGHIIGRATRTECHGNPAIIHPVVHLHVFDRAGRLYLQKRARTKDLLPGFWDTSVGGHIGYGEVPDRALERETMEELGFVPEGPIFRFSYLWRNPAESEFVYAYTLVYEGPIVINPDEIEDGRFFTQAEIGDRLNKGVLTPNFENEYALLSSRGIV